MSHYYEIPDYPEEMSAKGIIMRLLDGLGFRFYWATEGLSESDYSYARACVSEDSQETVYPRQTCFLALHHQTKTPNK